MSEKIKVFCINPAEQQVSQVEISGLMDIYAAMECSQVECITGKTLAAQLTEWWSIDDMFVDEEIGMRLDESPKKFKLKSFGSETDWLYGSAIVLGTDEYGNSFPPGIDKSALEEMIVWEKPNHQAENVGPADFSGSDYDKDLDFPRLKGQMLRIYACLLPGEWWTLREIEEETGDPQASISAQIRNLRKEKFGSHVVERRRNFFSAGTWEYQINDPVVFECRPCNMFFEEDELEKQWVDDPYCTGDSPPMFEYTCLRCGEYVSECDRQQG